MSELMMSSPRQFPIQYLCTEMTKISYFSYENVVDLPQFLSECELK